MRSAVHVFVAVDAGNDIAQCFRMAPRGVAGAARSGTVVQDVIHSGLDSATTFAEGIGRACEEPQRGMLMPAAAVFIPLATE